jgi:transaldolase
MIKIPATAEGLPAIQRSIAAGININITLIFSVARYEQVFDAFAAGMAERVQSGQPVERIASVASFFISRIDTLVDGMLVEKIKKGDAAVERLSGTAGIASAGAAMRVYRDCIAKPAWQELARAGARPQQLLWASTSTKNPAYSDIKYIEGLIAPDTINTIPPQTLAAYRDHGDPKVRIGDAVRDAPRVMAALADRGIHMNEVADELEAEALKKFSEPFDKLLAVIDKARKART